MGLEAVATVETFAAELTVDQAAWRGSMCRKSPLTARLSGGFSNNYINCCGSVSNRIRDFLAKSDPDPKLLYQQNKDEGNHS
jgi:hypothetical protein